MPTPPDPTPSMTGKTCVVTGGTSGIGAATVEALAAAGASVYFVGRDRARCDAFSERVRELTGNPDVYPLVADLSSMAEIRTLAEEILRRCPRLDVLVNNAGAMFDKRIESADGVEMTWALNHLSYYLLTNLLLDRLKASAPARVVNVASDAHSWAPGIDWEDVEGKRRYRTFRAYAQSKLANILFTYELARRLDGSGVTANVLHPGFVSTSFFLNKGRLGWLFKQLARVFSMAPEAGARTSVFLATSPTVANVSGGYFVKCKPGKSSGAAQDPEAARRLWALSEEATGLKAVTSGS